MKHDPPKLRKPKLPPGFYYPKGFTHLCVVRTEDNKRTCIRVFVNTGVAEIRPLDSKGIGGWTYSDKFDTPQEALNVMVARLWLGEFA
jgi:hypothetical protein